MAAFTGLVLAGRRGAAADPLAEASGADHRALLQVCGVPMLVRVVRALRGARAVGRIVVSIGEPETLRQAPELAALVDRGALETHRSLDSPSGSVLDVLEHVTPGEPVLVTTADHPLLTPAALDHFAQAAERSDADVLVGTVAGSLVRSRYPSTARTWLRLRDGDWCGANLFALRTPLARRAAEFWVGAEQLRKHPWRLVSAFGPVTLVLFALRRLDLDAALRRVSDSMGAQVQAIPLPFPEVAIDVDRPSDLVLVSHILGGGAATQSSHPPGVPRV